jgi:hypothetical protein
MPRLSVINSELIAARPFYTSIAPGLPSLFVGKPKVWIKVAKWSKTAVVNVYKYRTGKATAAELTGQYVFGHIKGRALRPVSTKVTKAHSHVQYLDHDWKRP